MTRESMNKVLQSARVVGIKATAIKSGVERYNVVIANRVCTSKTEADTVLTTQYLRLHK